LLEKYPLRWFIFAPGMITVALAIGCPETQKNGKEFTSRGVQLNTQSRNVDIAKKR
jgi:hypothetical protein